jgi:hypothetical protein
VAEDSPLLVRLREMWEHLLRDAVAQLPELADREIAEATARPPAPAPSGPA